MPDAEGVELANWNSGIFDIITSSAFVNAKGRDGRVRWQSLGPSPATGLLRLVSAINTFTIRPHISLTVLGCTRLT